MHVNSQTAHCELSPVITAGTGLGSRLVTQPMLACMHGTQKGKSQVNTETGFQTGLKDYVADNKIFTCGRLLLPANHNIVLKLDSMSCSYF